MDKRARAELQRLQRALETGPQRRIAADDAAGRPRNRADMEQADRYIAEIAALGVDPMP